METYLYQYRTISCKNPLCYQSFLLQMLLLYLCFYKEINHCFSIPHHSLVSLSVHVRSSTWNPIFWAHLDCGSHFDSFSFLDVVRVTITHSISLPPFTAKGIFLIVVFIPLSFRSFGASSRFGSLTTLPYHYTVAVIN